MEKIKALHIDTEQTWRGGENQMCLFMEGSEANIESYLACLEYREAAKRLGHISEVLSINIRSYGIWDSVIFLSNICRRRNIKIMY